MMKNIYKYLIPLTVAGTIFARASIASAQLTRQEAIDRISDVFFYQVNPELHYRKIQPDETLYVPEWRAIQNAVSQNIAYRKACDDDINNTWALADDRKAYDQVADAVFYSRHPERLGRRISPDETDLSRKWSQIRNSIYLADCYH